MRIIAGNWYPPVKAKTPPNKYEIVASGLAMIDVDLKRWSESILKLARVLNK